MSTLTTEQLIWKVIANDAVIGALIGNILGTIGAADIDTRSKCEARQGLINSNCPDCEELDLYNVDMDELKGRFPGGG